MLEYKRKLIRIGNSLALTIPPAIAAQLSAAIGATVSVVLMRAGEVIRDSALVVLGDGGRLIAQTPVPKNQLTLPLEGWKTDEKKKREKKKRAVAARGKLKKRTPVSGKRSQAASKRIASRKK